MIMRRKNLFFSCQACLCSDCVNGRQNHCEKIRYFRTKQQHTQSEESSASEDEDLGESLDEDDNEELFPQHLCVEDQNLALNSDFRLRPDVPYTLGTVENLIASFCEEADKSVILVSPSLFNKMKKSSRTQEHKNAFSEIRADKTIFAGIVHIQSNLSDGHFVCFEINTTQRSGFHLTKKLYRASSHMLTTTDMLIIFLTFENETYTRYVDTFFTFGKSKICDVALYFHNNSAKLTYETSWRKTSIFTSLDDLTPSDSAKLNKDLNNVTRSVYAKKGVSTKDFEVEFIETLRSG